MKNTSTLVVTRHLPLIALLRERGIIADDAEIVEHATPEQVRGRIVVGVLPLRLAAEAERVVEIPLALTREDREAMGRDDLTLERLREIAGDAIEYSVCRVRDVSSGDLDAMETSRLDGWNRRSQAEERKA